jgi:hypothetical protein
MQIDFELYNSNVFNSTRKFSIIIDPDHVWDLTDEKVDSLINDFKDLATVTYLMNGGSTVVGNDTTTVTSKRMPS